MIHAAIPRTLRSLIASRHPVATTTTCHRRRLVALSSASMVAAKEPPTFYYNKLCPFAHRAWLAISEKGIDYKPVHIDLKNKGQDFEDLYHTVNTDPKSSAKVPVLIDHGATIIESALVVEYLDKAYPDAGPKLYPDDPAAAFKVKLFIETFTEQFATFGLLRASTKAQLKEREEKFVAGLKVLDDFLKRHGSSDGGSYFLGSTYSAAETITTPLLRRSLVALPALRDFDVWAAIKADKLDRLEAWINATLDRPSNKSTGPSDEEIVEGWKAFTTPLED